MKKTDLSLISAQDLTDELESRFESFIVAWIENVGGERLVRSRWNENNWIECLGIAKVLSNDIFSDMDNSSRSE